MSFYGDTLRCIPDTWNSSRNIFAVVKAKFARPPPTEGRNVFHGHICQVLVYQVRGMMYIRMYKPQTPNTPTSAAKRRNAWPFLLATFQIHNLQPCVSPEKRSIKQTKMAAHGRKCPECPKIHKSVRSAKWKRSRVNTNKEHQQKKKRKRRPPPPLIALHIASAAM